MIATPHPRRGTSRDPTGRRERRFDRNSLVGVCGSRSDGIDSAPLLARTLNVSRHGVELEFDQPLPRGATLELSLIVGPEEIVDVRGTVRHLEEMASGKFRIGIELHDIPPSVQQMIDSSIQRISTWEARLRSARDRDH